jgi:hypothetical protein
LEIVRTKLYEKRIYIRIADPTFPGSAGHTARDAIYRSRCAAATEEVLANHITFVMVWFDACCCCLFDCGWLVVVEP